MVWLRLSIPGKKKQIVKLSANIVYIVLYSLQSTMSCKSLVYIGELVVKQKANKKRVALKQHKVIKNVVISHLQPRTAAEY